MSNNRYVSKYGGFLGEILPENAVSLFLEKHNTKRRPRANLSSLSYQDHRLVSTDTDQ